MAAIPHLKEGSPEWALYTFLKQHPPKKTLIVAVSGGPDSIALYELLHFIKPFIPFDLAVAHVHHGVRKESDEEASYLQQLAASKGDRFYLKKLSPIHKNFEDEARKARYEFFFELFKSLDAQCCLIGHHADDVAETVLKRIFEGSSFESLKAMQPVSFYKEMPLWRPFLSIPKKNLMQYPHFTDPTNLNGMNLRAKMRRELIPNLEESFGKKISSSLLKVSREAEDFTDYLNTLFPDLNLSKKELQKLHPFLIKQYLRRWLKNKNLNPTDTQLENLKKAIQSSHNGQLFIFGSQIVKVQDCLTIQEI